MQGLRHNTPNTPSHSLVSSRPLRVPMMSPVKLAGRKTGENVGKFEDSPIVFCTCTDVLLIGQIIAELLRGRRPREWSPIVILNT